MNDRLIEDTIKYILSWEKGYVDHPNDKGGPTNFGITMPTLSRWLGRPATNEDIRNLDMATATAIYRRFFVIEKPYSKLTDPWTFKYVVDMGVLHKPKSVAKIVQKAARPLLKVDGHFGPKTIEMCNKLPTVQPAAGVGWREKLRRERVFHYTRTVRDDRSQGDFVLGWTKRALAL